MFISCEIVCKEGWFEIGENMRNDGCVLICEIV